MANTREQIIEKFIEIAITLKRYPSYADLEAVGLTINSVRHHFISMPKLIEDAHKFNDRLDTELFGSETFTATNLTATRSKVKDFTDFIISTAVSGCSVHEGALDALKTWRSEQAGSMLIFQPIKDPARPKTGDRMLFDPLLAKEAFAFDDVALNENVNLSAILQSAKQLNPHTGLGRIANRNGLNIIASPKQQLTPIANMQGNGGGFLLSPGAVTLPDYSTEMYMSHRTAYLSKALHTLGAAAVRIISPKQYFFTNIQFDSETGNFTHLGLEYGVGAPKPVSTDFMVLGDLHTSELRTVTPIINSIKYFQPRSLVLHDIFSGVSINPFDRRSAFKRHLAHFEYAGSLADELQHVRYILERLLKAMNVGELVVVRGNHDMFLDQWIHEGRYAQDDVNIRTGLALAEKLIDRPDIPAIQLGLEYVGMDMSRVKFLQEDSSYVINGYELGQHGHAGSHGSRNPSLDKCVKELGKCVVGHNHTSEIHPMGGFRVGTMLPLGKDKPSYARKGPCMWSQSFVVGYSNGQAQLIQLVNGDINF